MRDTISDVFAALANETRRGIYERLLASTHGLTATELSEVVAVSRQAIVKHLQVLARAGLAAAERDGKEVRYYATANGTSAASTWLIKSADAWDRRIAKLDGRVRSTTRRGGSNP
jgi:predicted transcriptional regulator